MKSLLAILFLSLFLNIPAYSLTKEEAEAELQKIYAEWLEQQKTLLSPYLKNMCITEGELRMPIDIKVYGKEPSNGRSLWISMHGGGGTTQKVNDGQWRNQTLLYQPKEGVYVCPRAPWNEWNMWFMEPIDNIFEKLIRLMVATHNVNPDKVYIMGYSAGGDGVWRLAPRLADHWASAAMMAGHPGDVSLVNVRNLPFTIWVGGDDAAYNRNIEVAKRGEELDNLRDADPSGYVHETHVLPGFPHWMERNDTVAVPWMAQFTRNAHPKRIVWRQEEVLRDAFYWLEVPRQDMERGKTIIAEIKGNVINIEKCDYRQFSICLSDDMINLDKAVTIKYNGKAIKKIVPERKVTTLRETLYKRGDIRYAFPVKIDVAI